MSKMARVFAVLALCTACGFAQETLTNESVLKMVKAGLSEDIIVSAITQHPDKLTKFSLTPDGLIELKAAGVTDKVIAVMQQKNSTPASAPAAVAKPVESIAPKPIVLQDGTPVRLRLNRNLSSADAKVGESVDFEVLDDVKVGDVVVIAKGGTALATVTEAQPKRRMGRGGKLNVNIDYVRLINGDKVALRAVKETKGGGHTGAMTGGMVATAIVFFPAAPFFLFMHGKDISIPKGTEITAYVNGDTTIDPARLKGASFWVPLLPTTRHSMATASVRRVLGTWRRATA